jgi:hypothetical protein
MQLRHCAPVGAAEGMRQRLRLSVSSRVGWSSGISVGSSICISSHVKANLHALRVKQPSDIYLDAHREERGRAATFTRT